MRPPRLTLRRAAIGLAILAVVGAGGGFIVAWSGLYNIAASSGHIRAVERFLRFGLTQSVDLRAPNGSPDLEDPDLIRLGAGHFYAGCAYCHGAPGTPISPVAAAMLPAPPSLVGARAAWTAGELFWIVKHGIKYTGMPAWPAASRDDEVWAMVAFLWALPGLDAVAYRRLAMGGVEIAPSSGRELALASSVTDAVGACARCHGAEDRPPPSARVPRLQGQPAEMLRAALEAYAAGTRHSGIMQLAVSGLSTADLRHLADYYARLPSPAPAEASAGQEAGASTAAGRHLAAEGRAVAGIPPCLSCHGPDASPLYPRLAGQSSAYLAAQLHAWKRGDKGSTALNAIMAPIAERLTPDDIAAVSTYFATLDPAGETGQRDAKTGRPQ
ncbi:c-type cytochrome [Aquabacter spiritensis]|uniref:Cytochrome c553 n=1 Tax=Aquabacter spiritensis TaxID=933073 RepID=A0A4R3M499_9HYPH|nr:c-type cytochrome [Aquabacter spiritensis]TCT07656.1 cytochrome c553 [Aquabacter spiritensis]